MLKFLLGAICIHPVVTNLIPVKNGYVNINVAGIYVITYVCSLNGVEVTESRKVTGTFLISLFMIQFGSTVSLITPSSNVLSF